MKKTIFILLSIISNQAFATTNALEDYNQKRKIFEEKKRSFIKQVEIKKQQENKILEDAKNYNIQQNNLRKQNGLPTAKEMQEQREKELGGNKSTAEFRMLNGFKK